MKAICETFTRSRTAADRITERLKAPSKVFFNWFLVVVFWLFAVLLGFFFLKERNQVEKVITGRAHTNTTRTLGPDAPPPSHPVKRQ